MIPSTLHRQYIAHAFRHGDGMVEYSALGLATGMGLTPDGLPPANQRMRLLLRSEADSDRIGAEAYVGAAVPASGVLTIGSEQYQSPALASPEDGWWLDHVLVVTSGSAQGETRRIKTSTAATNSVTFYRKITSFVVGDTFFVLPSRVNNHSGVTHAAGSYYYYAIRDMTPLGVIGPASEPTRVEIAAGPTYRGDSPNAVRYTRVTPITGGKFRITWMYAQVGHSAPPLDFQAFSNGGAGAIDYNTPLVDGVTGLSSVPYTGAGSYRFTTPVHADGVEPDFAVVARTPAAVAQLGDGGLPSSRPAKASGPVAAKEIARVSAINV